MTVSTAGGTVNYITFNNDNDVDVNITTGATEGSFSVTIDNGISKTFDSVLLIILGTVYKPVTAEWTKSIVEPNTDTSGNVEIINYNSSHYAIWNKEFDILKDFHFEWQWKRSPLGELASTFGIIQITLHSVLDDSVKFSFGLRDPIAYHFTGSNLDSYSATEVYIGSPSFNTIDDALAYYKFSLRHLNGVFYFYANGLVKRTFTNNPSENLKLKVVLKKQNLVDIKYIELA